MLSVVWGGTMLEVSARVHEENFAEASGPQMT